MGLPKSAINLLIATAKQQPFSGVVATLGRQHVYASAAEVTQLAKLAGVPLVASELSLHRHPELQQRGYVSDDSLLAMLGFSSSQRIDHSDYEQAEVQFDLNSSTTPAELTQQYDAIIDSGTIEHVFDLPNALRHCLRMLKPNGRMIHLTPTSNCVNHGFYSISPTLYDDFYRANGCTVETLYLCRMPQRFERQPWQVYDCSHSDRNWLPLGRLDGSIYFTYCVARKASTLTSLVNPQQAFYESTWSASSDQPHAAVAGEPHSASPVKTKAERLLQATAGFPLAQRCAQTCISRWRSLIAWRRERARGRVPYPYVGKF